MLYYVFITDVTHKESSEEKKRRERENKNTHKKCTENITHPPSILLFDCYADWLLHAACWTTLHRAANTCFLRYVGIYFACLHVHVRPMHPPSSYVCGHICTHTYIHSYSASRTLSTKEENAPTQQHHPSPLR